MRRLTPFLALTVLVLLTTSAAAGPVSQLVLTAGDNRTDWIVQGTGVVTSWSTGSRFEYPVAVFGTIRTTSPAPGGIGGEYTLAGVPTGLTFTNGLAGGNIYDGAADAQNFYAVNYGTGEVVRFDQTWANPQVLFTAGAVSSLLGITYDPTNNSLWVAGWDTGTITNYSMTGTVLSSFTVPFNSISCLALDPADGTLWFGSQNTEGTFYQYSKAGVSLSTQVYPALASQNTLGGEFGAAGAAATEPLVPTLGGFALAALALALAGIGAFFARRV